MTADGLRFERHADPHAAFRADVRAWLAEHCPPSMRSRPAPDEVAVWGGRRQEWVNLSARQWLDAMAAKGWTAPTWPVECGGAGLSPEQAAVLAAELRAIGARPPIVPLAQGLTMLGPTLLQYGTAEQQRRFLPPTARGEIRWGQGFSEPDAGSDLAGVRTKAERHGDTYRVNGQKIWSSYAHVSDWIFCLVRTNPTAPKHEGIGFLLIDLASPGVDVAPITLISGKSDFCEVFFTDVAVPADQLIGGPGQGWVIAKRLLQHERAMLGSAGGALAGTGSKRRSLPELARAACGAGEGPLPDEARRERLADHLMEVRGLKALTRRLSDERRIDPAVPSMLKLLSTETFMAKQDLTIDLLGLDGLTWDDSDAAQPARDWLRSRANSIEGGTSEIQLNIIAKQVLGPPQAGPQRVTVNDTVTLAPTDEERLLRETARSFVTAKSPVAEVRRWRDADGDDDFSRLLYEEMAALGWAGLAVPAASGGAGVGLFAAGLVMEELGRELVATPLLSTVVGAICLAGSAGDGVEKLLAELLEGRSIVAVAVDGPPGGPSAAVRVASGRLGGRRAFVIDGAAADHLIVPAGPAGVFLVNAAGPGVTSTWTRLVDSRRYATVVFDEAEPAARLGGQELEATLLDQGAALLAAEMLGGAQRAFDLTVSHLRNREQFGVPLASFQALQHRVARLFVALEVTRSVVAEALRALDDGAADAAEAASTAKALAGETFRLSTAEAVQLHGGVGITDECDIGLYLKRARVAERLFGDGPYHRRRFAALRGF